MENQANTYINGSVAAMNNIIDIHIERKIYKKRSSETIILSNFQLSVIEGETLAIVGKSGVGKSSLLNIIGLIDNDFIGSYRLFGKPVNKLSDARRASWRNQRIGFVLQESALINTLNIEDNIKLPLLYAKPPMTNILKRFSDIVEHIGIQHILNKKPLECSGGEKARAVFARAIIMNPSLILADEPTGALDSENREIILQLLHELNSNFGTTIITVTHDPFVAEHHNKVIQLKRRF